MKRLAIIITHPIQYYAPIFQHLAKNVRLKVFYTGGKHGFNRYDKGFGQHINWNIPILQGYNYEFLENNAFSPGSHHFFGVINKNAIERIGLYRPSAILIYGWAYLSHTILLRHFYGKTPILFRGDSKLVDRYPFFKGLVKAMLLRMVYKHVNTALYVGSKNKAYFKRFGLNDSQLVFAPHAIDNHRFQKEQNTESKKLRCTLGIRPSDIVILFAGKLKDIKNPGILLEAFCQINSPNAHLVVVGSGELLQDLKVYTESQKAKNTIHFLPFQNQAQMPAIYQACDLFCMTTKHPGETWGLAVNEAMAAGKAILTSDQVGSATDLVCENNGQIFRSEDLGDLIEKLTFLLQDKQALANLGENSRRKISAWSIEKQVQQILAHV
jgi:glycosyltransferase involved in cell wall biosynthesis